MDHVLNVMTGWTVLKDKPTPTSNVYPAHRLVLRDESMRLVVRQGCGSISGDLRRLARCLMQGDG